MKIVSGSFVINQVSLYSVTDTHSTRPQCTFAEVTCKITKIYILYSSNNRLSLEDLKKKSELNRS